MIRSVMCMGCMCSLQTHAAVEALNFFVSVLA